MFEIVSCLFFLNQYAPIITDREAELEEINDRICSFIKIDKETTTQEAFRFQTLVVRISQSKYIILTYGRHHFSSSMSVWCRDLPLIQFRRLIDVK
jgi:hypothetical protein